MKPLQFEPATLAMFPSAKVQLFAAQHDCSGGPHLFHADGSVTVRVGMAKDRKIAGVHTERCWTMKQVRDALGY